MSNNDWRITGAVGIDPDPTVQSVQEVLLQGIGFPLRPIGNVPPSAFPDVGAIVAIGTGVQFMAQGWEEGKAYPTGAMLSNGIFTMIADKLTLDYPYPAPDGNPTFTLPTFTPATQDDVSVVFSGLMWTFTENVLVETLRVWVPEVTADTTYRILFTLVPFPGAEPVATSFEATGLTAGQWNIIAKTHLLIPAGAVATILLNSDNSSTTQEITGRWDYAGTNNNRPPGLQAWNNNTAHTELRVNKFDLASQNREADLLSMGVNSILRFENVENPSAFDVYRVTAPPIDAGTTVDYFVVLQAQGEGGVLEEATTLTATIPTAQTTEYSEDLAGLANPAWATVVPVLQFDGVDQSPASDTAFGVDIQAEITNFSEDWDVLSFNA